MCSVRWGINCDTNWFYEGFLPSNLCALRTVKADLICEVATDVTEKLSAEDPMWMETGKYGLIQFATLKE